MLRCAHNRFTATRILKMCWEIHGVIQPYGQLVIADGFVPFIFQQHANCIITVSIYQNKI
jgi:hypothetical protein